MTFPATEAACRCTHQSRGSPSTLADQAHTFIFDRLAELKSEQSE